MALAGAADGQSAPAAISSDSDADLEQVQPPPTYELFFAANHGDEGESYAVHLGCLHPVTADSDWSWNPQLLLGGTQNTAEEPSAIAGFDLMLRWTPGQSEPDPADRFDWFVELGAGVQYTGPESFPQFGTHANGRLRAGLGATWQAGDDTYLVAGLGWLHMSNGNVFDVNVGHDGPMGYLGLRFGF